MSIEEFIKQATDPVGVIKRDIFPHLRKTDQSSVLFLARSENGNLLAFTHLREMELSNGSSLQCEIWLERRMRSTVGEATFLLIPSEIYSNKSLRR